MSEYLDNISISSSKATTQTAFLEYWLARWRTKKVLPYITGKRVLDFGCGRNLWTLKSIKGKAKFLGGYDLVYKNMEDKSPPEFVVSSSLEKFKQQNINCIVALAVFEHMEVTELREVLNYLFEISDKDCLIVGTVPTPRAQPILEFLSYRLKLIDPSQIKDHKVYYNKKMLNDALLDCRWKMKTYQTFQLGCNSFFVLKKLKLNNQEFV